MIAAIGSVLRRVAQWLWAVVVLVVSRGRRDRRHERRIPTDNRGQLRVAALLWLSALAAVAFVVVYAGDADNQLLGITMGAALGFLAAALIVASREIVPQEPVSVAELEDRSYLTAFPKGADKEALASPILVLKLDPAELELPIERRSWAPQGVMAFSKICTHAGCSVGLYRSPLYPDQAPGPALVCPCHYSTFDVLKAGEVIFGPAGRPLPQLPLRIEASGLLVAAGGLSGNHGPAWAGVRQS